MSDTHGGFGCDSGARDDAAFATLQRLGAKLDTEQAQAAMAEENCVVTAGAGAGKTTTLASRYIYLVMEKRIPVRRILALTFTRKAAAEMYGRIYGELAKIPSPWALEQLSEFPNAQIMTIDSFCASVVRQGARDFGYTPDFTIDDERSAQTIATRAENFVIANAHRPGLAELLKTYPLDSVTGDLFCEVAKKYVTPVAIYSKLFAPMKGRIRTLLAETTARKLDKMQDIARDIVQISSGIPAPKADCRKAIDCSVALKSLDTLSTDAPGQDFQSINTLPMSEAWRETVNRTASLGFRSYARSENETTVKEKAKLLKELAIDVRGLREFGDFLPIYDEVLDRLDEFARECAEAKRMADLMDYKDLGLCAIEILTKRKDIRKQWKQGIDSILIDEFQDNNNLQRDLLYLLAERPECESDGIPKPESLADGKLFFVGDEKQSIYRFRGADVSVFKRLAGELAGANTARDDERNSSLKSHNLMKKSRNFTLSTNYRSSAVLIDFFNSFFTYAMNVPPVSNKYRETDNEAAPASPGGGGDAEMSGDTDSVAGIADFYARYVPMRAANVAGNENVCAESAAPGCSSDIAYFLLERGDKADACAQKVDGGERAESAEDIDDAEDTEGLILPDDSDFLDPDDNLAFEIAKFIKTNQGKLRLRPDAATAEYEDFAILLRTTANQHRLEKYLRLLDIPFEAESQRSLFRESTASDLYNILTLFTDPGDKAAFAAVLRSPLCRISDEGFMALLTCDNHPCAQEATAQVTTAQEATAVRGVTTAPAAIEARGTSENGAPRGTSFEASELFVAPAGADLSEYDLKMLDRARQFYQTLVEKARTYSVAKTLLYAWHFSGIRLDIASKSESRFYLEQFDYLFEIAASVDDKNGDIGDFLDALRPYIKGEIEKFDSSAVPQRRQAGVHIMTIHKAKGLQFPIVILPWVENSGSRTRGQKLWHMLPEGLTIDIKPYDKPGATASNIFFKLASASESLKDDAEIRRLLYVACTRAEDHLFFFGKSPRSGCAPQSFMWYLESYLEAEGISALNKKVLQPCKAEEVRRLRKPAPHIAMSDFASAYQKAYGVSVPSDRMRVSAVFVNSAAIGALPTGPLTQTTALTPEVSANIPAGAERDMAMGGKAGEADTSADMIPPKRFGILCHDIVEWAIGHDSTDGYTPSHAVEEGIEPARLSAAIDSGKLLAAHFIDSGFWRQIVACGAACTIATEKAFMVRLGDLIIDGRMDLFVETPERIDIIDFKTDLSPEAGRYRVQLEIYRHAAQRFSGGKDIRIGIFWLKPSTLEWQEAAMPEDELVALCAGAAKRPLQDYTLDDTDYRRQNTSEM